MKPFEILETPTFKYKLYPEQTFWAEHLKKTGIFQGGGVPFIKEHVTDYSLALDIGANIGMSSMLYSTMFDKVVGFEPQSRIYAQALDNLELNGIENCVIHNVGLGDSNAPKCITNKECDTHNDGKAHLVDVGPELEVVEMRTLDEYNLSPSFIKSDSEGFELSVLKGGVETLKRCKPVVLVEVNGLLKRYGHTTKELFDFMESLGYTRHGARKDSVIFT
jgi:FkbM family methyltransferase